MGLGIRQLRRLEGDALQALSGVLAAHKTPGPTLTQAALDLEDRSAPAGTQQAPSRSSTG